MTDPAYPDNEETARTVDESDGASEGGASDATLKPGAGPVYYFPASGSSQPTEEEIDQFLEVLLRHLP